MDPRLLLYTEGKPYVIAGGLAITEDGAWPLGALGDGYTNLLVLELEDTAPPDSDEFHFLRVRARRG